MAKAIIKLNLLIEAEHLVRVLREQTKGVTYREAQRAWRKDQDRVTAYQDKALTRLINSIHATVKGNYPEAKREARNAGDDIRAASEAVMEKQGSRTPIEAHMIRGGQEMIEEALTGGEEALTGTEARSNGN